MATVSQFQQTLTIYTVSVLLIMTFAREAAANRNMGRNQEDSIARSRSFRRSQNTFSRYYNPGSPKTQQRSKRPNIILVLTDDQDELLGSMSTMTKTLKIMGQEGIQFNNSFVSTPMCCPSRSTLLTGLYPHNHHVYTNNDNCSGTEWQKIHEPRTFAKYLSDAGYRTGFFGKYLNEYNGTYIPPGWREWVGLVKNSRFYNYTLNFNGQKVKHDDNYYRDYFTDLIANDSVTFLKQSKQYFSDKPVMMMLSVPAPHGPEDSAPQYQHMFENNTQHRTPSWNYMNNSDKQWLLKEIKLMQPMEMAFTDLLQRKRLQTLQSVDSLMEKIYYQLRLLNELDNTYIIYTSDHGYHLGQFGILKGKALPYDFDIRVPLFIRGPGVLRDTKIPNIVGNVDIAPTILDMAGLAIPDHMDGRSMLTLIKHHKQENNVRGDLVFPRRPWRNSLLIERGKVTMKIIRDLNREKDDQLLKEQGGQLVSYVDTNLRKTLKICADPSNQEPCKLGQRWVCLKDHKGRKRAQKCRNYNRTTTENEYLPDSLPYGRYVPRAQELYTRNKRSPMCDCSQRNKVKGQSRKGRRNRRSNAEEQLMLRKGMIEYQLQANRQRCRYLPNNTFTCDRELITDPQEWEKNKQQLDEMIEETRRRLRNLKKMRIQLRKQKKIEKDRGFIFDINDSEEFEDDDIEPTNVVDNIGGEIVEEAVDDCNCDDEDEEEEDNIEDFEEDNFTIPTELGNYKPNHTNYDEKDSEEIDPYKHIKGRKRFDCDQGDLKCSIHDKNHWKTPPYWTLPPLCICSNAVYNTYWCLRTINRTHDFLYCEYIDSFLEFYNFKTDPHQLHNVIKTLDYGIMHQLHEELDDLRRCVGWKQCNKGQEDNDISQKRRRRRKVRKSKLSTKNRLEEYS